MIKLYFKAFLKEPVEIKVNLEDIIFEVINQILSLNKQINSLFIKNNDKIYYFGYDIKLNKKFSNYFFQENNNYTIFTHSVFDPLSNKYKIQYPILYYNNNKEWPPSDNWNEGDPINSAPFLIWNGYGRGAIKVDQELDNNYKNLIVLKYHNFKKIVNKYGFLISIMKSPTKSIDPITNKIIKNDSLINLYELLQKKQKNNELLPEVKIDFLQIY